MQVMCKIMFVFFFVIPIFISSCANKALSQTSSTSELGEYKYTSSRAQNLISDALALSEQRLRYQFGSADPKNGGLDCSGTIYYLLQSHYQIDVPRQADQIYKWTKQQGKFYPVKNRRFSQKEFSHLKPGDLLFWTGTYKTKRKQQVTHVMLYLGKNQHGNLLMFGANNGRTHKNMRARGVSVFDFKLPSSRSKSRFIGYSCIPGVNCSA